MNAEVKNNRKTINPFDERTITSNLAEVQVVREEDDIYYGCGEVLTSASGLEYFEFTFEAFDGIIINLHYFTDWDIEETRTAFKPDELEEVLDELDGCVVLALEAYDGEQEFASIKSRLPIGAEA